MKSPHSAPNVAAIWQQGMARRRFLKWSLLGSAGVAAVAAGGFAFLRRSPPVSYTHLRAHEPRHEHV